MKWTIAVLNSGLGGRGTPLNLSKIPALKSPAELTTQIFIFKWKPDSKWFDGLSLACSMFYTAICVPPALTNHYTEFWRIWLLSLYFIPCGIFCAAFLQYNFLHTYIIIESWIFACFLLCCSLPPPQLFRGNYNHFKYFAYAARQSRKFIWQTGLQLSARKQSGENISNNFSMSMSGRCSENTEITHKEEEFYIYSFNKAKRPMKIMYFLSPHPKLNYKTLSNNWKPNKVHPLLQIISIFRNSILTAHELNHVCEHFYKLEWLQSSGTSHTAELSDLTAFYLHSSLFPSW